tara:strand:- start:3133 stop:3441 length:309 start_codon:yes stop_codon:yes gene_type:complete
MDSIVDEFSDFLVYPEHVDIKKNETKEYYIGKAEYILNTLNKDNYFEFLKVFLKKYKTLDIEKQKEIETIMNIKPTEKIIVKEIIKFVNNKKSKPKLNIDDY